MERDRGRHRRTQAWPADSPRFPYGYSGYGHDDYYDDYGLYEDRSRPVSDHPHRPYASRDTSLRQPVDSRRRLRKGQQVTQPQTPKESKRDVPSTPVSQPSPSSPAEGKNGPQCGSSSSSADRLSSSPSVREGSEQQDSPQGAPASHHGSSSSLGEGSEESKTGLASELSSDLGSDAKESQDIPLDEDKNDDSLQLPAVSAAEARPLADRVSPIEPKTPSDRGASLREKKTTATPTDGKTTKEVLELRQRMKELEALIKKKAESVDMEQQVHPSLQDSVWDLEQTDERLFAPPQASMYSQSAARAGRTSRDYQWSARNRSVSSPIDDRLANVWMKEVKRFDPDKRNFRAWLLEAELLMDSTWDFDTRVRYLSAKLDPMGIAKLDRVLQYMDSSATPKIWEEFRKRLLKVFPGTTDPNTAEFHLMEHRQMERETFQAWVDRMTKMYIDAVGQMPRDGVLDKLIFWGLRIPYKIQWRKKPPLNLLDAIESFQEWEQDKWQALGLSDPTEGGAQVQLARVLPSDGMQVHPSRADSIPGSRVDVLTLHNDPNAQESKEQKKIRHDRSQ